MYNKKWYEQEKKGHHLRPYSKEWLKIERKEGHKAKIGTMAWRMEERKEHEHTIVPHNLELINPFKMRVSNIKLMKGGNKNVFKR